MTDGVAARGEVQWQAQPASALTGHLRELLTVKARFDAQIVALVDAVDACGAAELDGAGSTAAWLRWQGRVSPSEATATVMTARPAARAR